MPDSPSFSTKLKKAIESVFFNNLSTSGEGTKHSVQGRRRLKKKKTLRINSMLCKRTTLAPTDTGNCIFSFYRFRSGEKLTKKKTCDERALKSLPKMVINAAI